MSISADLFNDVYESEPEWQATATYADETIAKCLSVGIGAERDSTEIGLINNADGQLRYLRADEPAAWGGNNIIGKVISVTIAGGTPASYRVTARHPNLELIRLELESEHE